MQEKIHKCYVQHLQSRYGLPQKLTQFTSPLPAAQLELEASFGGDGENTTDGASLGPFWPLNPV